MVVVSHRYLAEYEIHESSGVDFRRTLSAYLNQLINLGCQVMEVAEPAPAPDAARRGSELDR